MTNGRYIECLHATNVGKFDNLNIDFNPKFNFLVGANGSGKTTVLKIIALIFNPENASSFRYGQDSEMWIDCVDKTSVHRIGLGKGWVKEGNGYRHARLTWWQAPPSEMRIINAYTANQIEDGGLYFVPVFFGAYRRIGYHAITGMIREQSPAENRNFYRKKAIESMEGGYLPNVKQWMINRYFMIDKDWAAPFKANWLWLINNLKIVTPLFDDFSFKEIKRDFEPVFILNGKECYLEELSAGFQAVLSLIFGIVDWIEAVNDEDHIFIREATGTVLIDELDAHLHPEWQLKIRDVFAQLFPSLQFIMTTHSPHLISSARQGEIIKIPVDKDVINVKPSGISYAGWSTEEILEDVMDVKGLENKVLALQIKNAMDAVESKNVNGLKKAIEKLQEIVHPNNIITETLKIKLAELMLVNGDDKD